MQSEDDHHIISSDDDDDNGNRSFFNDHSLSEHGNSFEEERGDESGQRPRKYRKIVEFKYGKKRIIFYPILIEFLERAEQVSESTREKQRVIDRESKH